MKNTKPYRPGRRILALLMSGCLLFGLFPGAAAAEGGAAEGELVLDKRVGQTEDGRFKLTLEGYATGSNTMVSEKPLPLDIVLVLDESGSMELDLQGGDGCGNKFGVDVSVTLSGHLLESNHNFDTNPDALDDVLFTGHKVFEENLDLDKTYRIVNPAAKSMSDATREVSYCEICDAWRSSNIAHSSHESSGVANWVPFSSDDEGKVPTNTATDEYKVQFYEVCDGVTGQKLLQEAVSEFLAGLQEDDADDNRVAIVGYGLGASYIHSDGDRKQVYKDRNSSFSKVDGAEELAAEAWYDVDDLDDEDIKEIVGSILANGTTCTHVGIQAAELAFDYIPKREDENRAQVMILFTDGVPGANSITYGPDRPQWPDWITDGIQSAYRMKDDGVTIYTVGLFPSANGDNAEDISYIPDADGDLNNTTDPEVNKEFYQNGNCFLHVVSSNYPDATGILTAEDWGDLSDAYNNGKRYYLGTEDADDLNDIFDQVLQSVTEGETTVTLGEGSVLRDIIADDFQIVNEAGSVTAYTMSYLGGNLEDESSWQRDGDDGSLTVDVDGDEVTVSGFDYSQNFVHMEGSTPEGKKLVVEILIEPTDDTTGGEKLPTNVESSGVYESESSDEPFGRFPVPYVDLPTTVTIQKMVEGSETTEAFSFTAGYVEAGEYRSSDTGDSNYLYLENGENQTDPFKLTDEGIHELQNVKVGSSLTIREAAAEGWTPTVTIGNDTEALTPDADGKYTVTVTAGMQITFTNRPETDPNPGETTVTLTYDANGGRGEDVEETYDEGRIATVRSRSSVGFYRPGYSFEGWNTRADGRGTWYDAGDTIVMNEDVTLYAIWDRNSGGGGSDDDDDHDDEDNGRPEPEDPAPELDTESHIAYVSGTPEGTVEPEAYITREEVATIFFRLLTDRSRANYITDYNPFPDVDSSRWSFYPIVTMNNGGIMHGYDDGNFAPGAYITRGEFAVVAAQFSDAQYSGADLFSDISGHWARDYINRAASEGWIAGYPDGSFGPNDYITRAQVMALVNEVLDRAPDADYMLDDMITWPDNADESAWYYEDVQEATNSHSYVWRNSSRTSEDWEDLIEMRTLNELVRDAFAGVGIAY